MATTPVGISINKVFRIDMYMNDVLYRDLVEPWLSLEDRYPVDTVRRWLVGAHLARNNKRQRLLTDVLIHTGSPCFRYCICEYFDQEDKDRFRASLRD
jgi:hypothetical protein